MKLVDVQVQGCFIGGEWKVPQKERLIEVKNPGDGSVLAFVPRGDKEEIDLAVTAAKKAFLSTEWKTFTGSVETGKRVMESAAKNIVPVTLELGGKSPNIVFADCNEEQALEWVLKSIVQNAGQTCSAGSRLVIEKSIKEAFVGELAAMMDKLSIGSGIDNHDLGPVLSKKQFERIKSFIDLAKQDGIRIATGGERILVEGSESGYYLQPTILDSVPASHHLAQEEIFGPVLTVTTFETEEEAIEIANGTPYGLVAGVWTENVGRAHRVASQLQCGQVFINHYGAGGGIAQPFGGYKKSGFGREKGLEALRNYTQVKNVALKY